VLVSISSSREALIARSRSLCSARDNGFLSEGGLRGVKVNVSAGSEGGGGLFPRVDMDLLRDIPEATFAFFPLAGGAGVVRLREPAFSFMVAL